jgi:hypothetical protein
VITVFVAPEDMTADQSPTRMFQRTHTLAFSNRCNRPQPHDLIMSADGEQELLQRKILGGGEKEGDKEREREGEGEDPTP